MKFKRVIMIAAMFLAVVPMVVYAIFSNNTLTASGEKEFSTIVTSVAENQASPLNALVSSVPVAAVIDRADALWWVI